MGTFLFYRGIRHRISVAAILLYIINCILITQIVVGTTGIGLIILILFAWLLKRHWYDMKQITIKKDSEFSILIEQI